MPTSGIQGFCTAKGGRLQACRTQWFLPSISGIPLSWLIVFCWAARFGRYDKGAQSTVGLLPLRPADTSDGVLSTVKTSGIRLSSGCLTKIVERHVSDSNFVDSSHDGGEGRT